LREEIESYLRQLVGLPLWGSDRALNMEMFQFGSQEQSIGSTGEPRLKGSFALHIQSPWRIRRETRILVGSDDVRRPRSSSDPDAGVDWDVPDSTLRDERMAQFFAEYPSGAVVTDVAADETGGLTVIMGLVRLEVFPSSTFGDDVEYWRCFQPGRLETHLVVRPEAPRASRRDLWLTLRSRYRGSVEQVDVA
jgi:hypothetical protein